MDSSTIKTLLESQERAYKNAMEIVTKQMNERMMKLESTVADLTTSLQFSQHEVDELKATVKELEREKQATKAKMNHQETVISSSKAEIEGLEERCNYMEDYSRRQNIRISGVEELSGGESWEQTAAIVSSLLEDKMQLPGLELERAHRVGQRRDTRPRTIVARFSRFRDREAAMRSARKLKGTNIYINDDLCAASLAIKNAQLPQLKQAKAQGKIAFFRHTKLIVREKTGENVEARGRRSTEVIGATTSGGVLSGLEPATSAAAEGQGESEETDTRGGPKTASGASAGAQGGQGPTKDSANAASGVTRVEMAGAWTGRSNTSSPLSHPSTRLGDSRLPSASPAATPSHQKENKKKSLRSSTKK